MAQPLMSTTDHSIRDDATSDVRPGRPALDVLTRAELRRAATVDPEVAVQQWTAALARPALPLAVSLLEDWAAYSGHDYPTMLSEIFAAQQKVDDEWETRRPEAAGEVATFYDETDTITPLLLWWHATEAGPARCAAAAASVFEAVGARRVFDFGAGIGSTALFLGERGFDVTLGDVARDCLRFADRRFHSRGRSAEIVDLLERDVDELPPGSFDGIVAFDVLEHLPDTAPAVAALARSLAPGGVFCFNEAYVPEDCDEPQHYPQRGEVLHQLHRLGFRLAHVTDVIWVAQKAPLGSAARNRQRLDLSARTGAVRLVEGRQGPLGRKLAFHVTRHALS